MKKILGIITSLVFFTSAQAIEGVNLGVSLSAGVFEVDGAAEKLESGSIVKKSSSEKENAEGLFAIGSVFVEKTLGERFAIGLDYVPHTLESETATNKSYDGKTNENDLSGTLTTNTVQVDFENLITIYGLINFNNNMYIKAGYMEVDANTNEKLNTGGAYDDQTLDGYTLALGYHKEMNNNSFVRLEANYMDFDGVTAVNRNDTTKSVSVDGISGYGAKLSVGKSF